MKAPFLTRHTEIGRGLLDRYKVFGYKYADIDLQEYTCMAETFCEDCRAFYDTTLNNQSIIANEVCNNDPKDILNVISEEWLRLSKCNAIPDMLSFPTISYNKNGLLGGMAFGIEDSCNNAIRVIFEKYGDTDSCKAQSCIVSSYKWLVIGMGIVTRLVEAYDIAACKTLHGLKRFFPDMITTQRFYGDIAKGKDPIEVFSTYYEDILGRKRKDLATYLMTLGMIPKQEPKSFLQQVKRYKDKRQA